MTAPPPRTAADVAAELADASRKLQTATESWRTLPPSRGAVVDVQICAEGLRRSLAELAGIMEEATPCPY